MKKMMMVLALMLAGATMMAPVSASAAFIGEIEGGRAYWETQVGTFSGVDLPGTTGATLAAYTEIALPYGGVFRTNEALQRLDVGAGWSTWNPYIAGTELLYTSAQIANFNFWPSGVDSPIQPATSFGFEIEPNFYAPFSILLYTAEGELSQTVEGEAGAKFFGWVNEEVYSFTVITYGDSDGFAMGRFVEGTTAVPEPSTLFLLGSGLIGLVGYGRRRMKK